MAFLHLVYRPILSIACGSWHYCGSKLSDFAFNGIIGETEVECRLGCGACCIAPSISSPIPGMPQGKPAGVRCVQLSDENLCLIFGRADRPDVCSDFKATADVCGGSNDEALWIITSLETQTN